MTVQGSRAFSEEGPFIVIVGATASGKTQLALQLARQYGGEIICADSRTVYTGMDIGTAKPSHSDRRDIRHHLLDIVMPDQGFSAAQFKVAALKIIDDINQRHKLPIMAGGTGLYVDAVLFDFEFREPADPGLRAELSRLSVEELQGRIRSMGLELPVNKRNPRHLIRVVEAEGAEAKRHPLRQRTLILGMRTERHILRQRIAMRMHDMLEAGLEREVRKLIHTYGPAAPGLQAIGYQEWNEYFIGDRDLEKTIELIQANTYKYAKRQETWLKRNEHITWVEDLQQATNEVEVFLRENS